MKRNKLPNKDSPSFSKTIYSAQRRPFVSSMGASDRRRGNLEPYYRHHTFDLRKREEKIGAGRLGMHGKERCGNRHFISIC